jgi:hypothetical protein
MPDGTPIRGTREKTLYVPGRIDGPARKVLRGLYIDRFEIKPIGNLGPDESAIKTIAYYVDGGNRGVLQLPAHKIGEGPFDEANSALREASTGDLATDWDRGSSGNYTLDELNVSSWLALLAEPREIETNATYRTKSRVLYPATRIKDSDGYLLPIQAEFKPNSGTVSGQFIRVKKTNLTSSFTYQQGNDSASTAGSSDQAAAVVDLYGGGLGYEKASSTVAIIDTDYAAGTTINQLSVYEIQSENILDGDHFYILPALGGSPIKLSILTKPSKGDTTLDVASFDAPMGIEEGSIIITSKKALQTFVAQTDKSFSVTVRDEALTTLDQSISAGTSYDSLDVDFFPTTLGQVSQSV